MKTAFKIFLTAVLWASACVVLQAATEWKAEQRPENGGKYYIYHPASDKWLGIDGTFTNGVSLKMVDQADAFEFQVEFASGQSDWRLVHEYSGRRYYMQVDGEQPVFTTRERVFNTNNDDNNHYSYYFSYQTNFLGFNKTYHYLTYDNDLNILRFKSNGGNGNDMNFCEWLFISEYQFTYRPKLEGTLSAIEDLKNNPDYANDPDLQKAYEDAKQAIDDFPTPTGGQTIVDNFDNLSNELGKAQNKHNSNASEEWKKAFNDLQGIMKHMGEVSEMLHVKYDVVPATFAAAFAKAQDDVSTGVRYFGDESKVSVQTLKDDKDNLERYEKVYTSRFLIYVKEMERIVNKMGYSFSNTVVTNMHTAVVNYLNATTDAARNTAGKACMKVITDEQAKYKEWVNTQLTSGGLKMLKGTDFSAYILNNSFGLGNVLTGEVQSTYTNWQLTNCAKSDVTDLNRFTGVHGDYFFDVPAKGNNTVSSIKQTISYLPKGTYRLSAVFGGAGTLTLSGTANGQHSNHMRISNSSHATVGNGGGTAYIDFEIVQSESTCTYTIGAQSNANTRMRVDNFRIEVLSGAVTYECNETAGFSNVVAGEYERITVTRNFVYNSSADLNYWNTLCSPCDIDEATASTMFSTIAEIVGIERKGDELVLKYMPCSSIEAGVPYLVKTKKAISSYEVLNAELVNKPKDPIYYSDEGDMLMVKGNFQPFASGKIPYYNDATTKTYVLAQNQFLQVTSNSTSSMKAFRVYYHVKKVGTGVSASRVRLATFDEMEEEFTGIGELKAAETELPQNAYNLLGQPVKASATGLLIENGKIRMIKK